jgi:60 kDa SS-A/Ro ribonucleoprotein
MANKSLFASMLGRLPKANAVNEAGGLAYKLEPKHALAQVAATGTFGNLPVRKRHREHFEL